MAPVTEIAYISLKPGVELNDESAGAKIWGETMATLQEQDGMQKIHYGRLIEEPNTVMLLVDWTTVEHHKTFMASPQYQPFKNKLLPLCTGLHLHHFVPSPFPSTVLDTAPVIEFATFFGVEPGFGDNVGKFLTQAGSPTPAGYYGHAYGPSVEDDLNKHAEQEVGEGSNAIVLLIGWESKEKHMEFRETEQFKENIALLRSGAKGAEMFHIEKITTIDRLQ